MPAEPATTHTAARHLCESVGRVGNQRVDQDCLFGFAGPDDDAVFERLEVHSGAPPWGGMRDDQRSCSELALTLDEC